MSSGPTIVRFGTTAVRHVFVNLVGLPDVQLTLYRARNMFHDGSGPCHLGSSFLPEAKRWAQTAKSQWHVRMRNMFGERCENAYFYRSGDLS